MILLPERRSSFFTGYFILFFLLRVSQIQADVVVVGYYTSWTKSTYPADKVKFENLTHINHAFAWPESNGNIAKYSNIPDVPLIAQTHLAGKKILISFAIYALDIKFTNYSSLDQYSLKNLKRTVILTFSLTLRMLTYMNMQTIILI